MYLDKNRPQFVRYVHILKGCRFLHPHDSSWGLGYNAVKHAKVVKTWNFLLNYEKVMVLKYFKREKMLNLWKHETSP